MALIKWSSIFTYFEFWIIDWIGGVASVKDLISVIIIPVTPETLGRNRDWNLESVNKSGEVHFRSVE